MTTNEIRDRMQELERQMFWLQTKDGWTYKDDLAYNRLWREYKLLEKEIA